MFIEKTEALQEKEKIKVLSAQLAAMVAKECKMVPKLHILEEAPLEAKIRKLVVSVRYTKAEVARVQFELNMKKT